MKRTFCVLSIFLYSAIAIVAQVSPSVSVIGEAEMKIAPDQVQFTFEIVTTDKAMATVKLANDRAAAQSLAAAKAFNIAPDEIQTDSLTVSPRYTPERRMVEKPKATLVAAEIAIAATTPIAGGTCQYWLSRASVYEPIVMNPLWPSEICPE